MKKATPSNTIYVLVIPTFKQIRFNLLTHSTWGLQYIVTFKYNHLTMYVLSINIEMHVYVCVN